MDILGPYKETIHGNLYIVNFVDWLTTCVDVFAIPDKRAQTIADLILTEMFLRYGTFEQIFMDNGLEKVNQIMRL